MEKRLIDANALLEKECCGRISGNDVRNSPTIDAVEVVRCKDCVHRRSKLYCPMCDLLADLSEDEGFCHCGEKEVEACS